MTLKDTLKRERYQHREAAKNLLETQENWMKWLDQHDTRILNALLEEIEGMKVDIVERQKARCASGVSKSARNKNSRDDRIYNSALTDLAEIIKSALEK